MRESLVAAFLGGLGIGVSAGFSFQIGTAIAKYLARKDISSDTASLGHGMNRGSDFRRRSSGHISNGCKHCLVKFFFRLKLLIQKLFLKTASDKRGHNRTNNCPDDTSNQRIH
jgi:hypothetical protein